MKPLILLDPVITEIVTELYKKGCQCLVMGGAVRDAILGIEPKDIDIEVYGVSYDDLMTTLGKYGKVDLVGKKFGVILFTPDKIGDSGITKYDFSIPRRENKIGTGHTEFDITLDSNMSIAEAAIRRDFTMNSLGWDPITNETHDYHGGLEDIKNRLIRHTSDKFAEDYLRILRAMQFQSRFEPIIIDGNTIIVIREMLAEKPDEFWRLSVERVFEEWMKWAEKGIDHTNIFKFMHSTGLIALYPELKALNETPQDAIYHPEGHVEIHTLLCLAHMDKIIQREKITGKDKAILVMATLLHDIAKPKCTEEQMKNDRLTITSNGHEEMGGDMAPDFLRGIGFNAELIEPIAKLVANHLAGVKISHIDKPSGKAKFVKRLSKRLFPATIQQLLYVMEADTNGRGGTEYKEPTGAADIRNIASELTITDKQYEYLLMGRHLIDAGLKPGTEFGVILKQSYEAQENGEFGDVEGAKEWLAQYLEYKRTTETV